MTVDQMRQRLNLLSSLGMGDYDVEYIYDEPDDKGRMLPVHDRIDYCELADPADGNVIHLFQVTK